MSAGSRRLLAFYYLLCSSEINSHDSQTVSVLAFAEQELGDIEVEQKHFQSVLEMRAPEELLAQLVQERATGVAYCINF
jgi:hypothetical protein